MGARALCQRVVEGSLKIRLTDGRWRSLAKARVEGVYVMDMIAHNNDHEKDVFQIAPGTGARIDAAGRSGPRGERDVERLDASIGTAAATAAASREAGALRTATRYPTRPCTCP